MRFKLFTLFSCFIVFVSFGFAYNESPQHLSVIPANQDLPVVVSDNIPVNEMPGETEKAGQPYSGTTKTADPKQFVAFAKQFLGTPYLYGSTNPEKGFDCSGFVNHVARHFGIEVPRSSVEFTNIGEEIQIIDAQAGDLILFTGTDSNRRIVGHIGIVTQNPGGQIMFIHSSSGNANGVTESALEGYYQTRFIKIVRIFQSESREVIV